MGDLAYVKLQPYRQTSLVLRQSLKLSAKYYGPYKIIAKIGKVAYKLELLPEFNSLCFAFHVSLLKKKVGTLDDDFTVAPEKVLKVRTILRGVEHVEQGLIKWYNLSPNDAT